MSNKCTVMLVMYTTRLVCRLMYVRTNLDKTFVLPPRIIHYLNVCPSIHLLRLLRLLILPEVIKLAVTNICKPS